MVFGKIFLGAIFSLGKNIFKLGKPGDLKIYIFKLSNIVLGNTNCSLVKVF